MFGHLLHALSSLQHNKSLNFRVVYRSWTFGFDSGIPRVTISGRFCDWTGSRGLHLLVSEPGYAIIGTGNEETVPPPPSVGGETNEDEVTWEILLVGLLISLNAGNDQPGRIKGSSIKELY
ncbi:hypothetical protein GQ457_09G019060 [Hibiscus cannabinus]